jgi:hypothetical protein
MEFKKFVLIPVSRLRLDAFTGFISGTVDIAGRYPTAISPTAQVALGMLQAHSSALNAVIHRSNRNPQTILIETKDRKRDVQFSEVKRNVKANLGSTLPAKAEAAQLLYDFLAPFGNINKLGLNDQTQEVENLQTRYTAVGNETLRSAASTLGIAELFDGLFEVNKEVKNLYFERMHEQVTLSPSASTIKGSVLKAYEMFSNAVQQDVNLAPTDKLLLLFDDLDKLRQLYASTLNRKTGDTTATTATTDTAAAASAEQ